MAIPGICAIPDCGKPARGRGWCNAHYQRWHTYGDPLAGRQPRGEPERHFRGVLLQYEGDECQEWPYGRAHGYGTIQWQGKRWLVHRLVCHHVHGPAPTPAHEAAHSCGKGHLGCVTKAHLSWKTPAENHADKIGHGTSKRGDRCNFTVLNEAQVHSIRELSKTLSAAKVATQFGVTPGAIYRIRQGKSGWNWLTSSPEACSQIAG